MKKLTTTILLVFVLQQTFACDICGCSSGNYFIGLFPQFRKHFIGTRYSFRSFHSRVNDAPDQFSRDLYQTAEIWTGINISKKWQVMAFVPYNINKQSTDDGIRHTNGLGDVSLIANYKLTDKRTVDKKGNRISQQIWIGGGIKLPTGKFKADPDDIIADANNQPGTGSTDLIINGMYTLHINNWGINTNINYKINNKANNFQFGNRFSSSAFVFRSISSAKTTFNPNAGLLYENLSANQTDDSKIEATGGTSLLAAAGLEINFGKVSTGFNAQLPITQHLSNGQTNTKVKGMMHVTFTF